METDQERSIRVEAAAAVTPVGAEGAASAGGGDGSDGGAVPDVPGGAVEPAELFPESPQAARTTRTVASAMIFTGGYMPFFLDETLGLLGS
jgi:hypothetical protein